MATKELTERQQEIKDLTEQGVTAKQIGERLGISTNGVYQQLRRMRDGGTKTAAAKTGRQSAGSAASAPAASTGTTEQRNMTPLQAIRARRSEIDADLKASKAEVDAAQKALDKATETHGKLEARNADEVRNLTAAEAALKGEPVTPEPPAAEATPNGTTEAAQEATTTPESADVKAGEAKPAAKRNGRSKPAVSEPEVGKDEQAATAVAA